MEHIFQTSLFVFMGLTGNGKTTLARTWARKNYFSYFNFDTVRKQLSGVSRVTGQHSVDAKSGYNPMMVRRTYDALLTSAEQEIIADRTVVLDACYGAVGERARLIQFADTIGAKVYFVLCYCSAKTMNQQPAQMAGGTQTSGVKQEHVAKTEEKIDPLDDIETTMVVSINTESTVENIMEQLDFAFEKGSTA